VFTHLHVHSCFSFLDGGSSVAALARRARECGYETLALTDNHGLYGAVRFHQACEAVGVRPILGATLTLAEDWLAETPAEVRPQSETRPTTATPRGQPLAHFQPGRVNHRHGDEQGYPLVLLAANRAGFRCLCRLITEAQLAHEKGHPRVSAAMLRRHQEGLFCLSGGERGPVAGPWLAGCRELARRHAEALREIFGRERFFVEVQNRLLPHSGRLLRELCGLAQGLGVRPVATNEVRYATKADFPTYDVLVCARTLTRVDERHPARPGNAEATLKSPAAMARLFREVPEALATAGWIANRCEESMEFGVYHFPDFPLPAGETPYSHLCKLCWEGAARRYRVIDRAVMRRLEYELDIIDRLGFSRYFLVMWDIVRWARERGIRCAGRGSAGDSLVTYVLGITEVDPLAHGLLFERFLNPARQGAPDIDIDFDANRRDEVINYVYERYGREHTAMVCTVYTLNTRSAVREVGKALDFPPEDLDRLAKALPHTGADKIAAAFEKLPELRDSTLTLKNCETLLELCGKVGSFPRHLSVHLGGMVAARERLDELVPLEWSAKGVVVTQWDKDDLEAVGLVKMDLLSLKNLAAIEDALSIIRRQLRDPGYRAAVRRRVPDLDPRALEQWARLDAPPPLPFDIDGLDFADSKVFALLQNTRTLGIFQVESPGMRALLGRLQPTCFDDLVAQISLFRPGPLTADMINPFIARRHGEEPIRYFHPRLKAALQDTYGVLLYQEQVLKIAHALAGFDYAQADLLRRAMTTDRSPEEMAKIQETFLAGCRAQGDVSPEAAARTWKALSSFAAYGFCKAHAVAFARTAYQTAWLKRYFPAEFLCAVLDNQPMGFYSAHTIIQDAKRLGIEVRGVDVNASEADYQVEAAAAAPRTSVDLKAAAEP